MPLTFLLSADAAATTEPSDSATSTVEETVGAVADATVDVLSIMLRLGAGVLVGVVLAFIGVVVLRMLGRHRALYTEIARYSRTPLYAVCALSGAYVTTQIISADLTASWRAVLLQALLIAVILSGTWFITQLLKAVESTVVGSVHAAGDQGRANRVTTQAQVLRRVAAAVVIVCGVVGAVMTFPSARFAMGSLVASAGLVSVIAGLAAQSTLGNVFAGIQLATTDAIRVDDVVEVNSFFGQIEEITLTYVVVKVWDERRLILPSTYFTENPFTNWSRRSHQMLGVVKLEVDWRVPIAQMRAELARVVAASRVWDGRTCGLVITETSSTTVTARVTVSAANPDDVWTLQCYVREELIGWMQREAPYALPRTRVEVEQVEVAHDPAPEEVARLAEELVALQTSGDDGALAATTTMQAVDSDPIEAARVRAVSRGRSPLRRSRRAKVRRRRILARDGAASEDLASEGLPARRQDATAVISTKDQETYLAASPLGASASGSQPTTTVEEAVATGKVKVSPSDSQDQGSEAAAASAPAEDEEATAVCLAAGQDPDETKKTPRR
ncbi:mechanosensitive ion channel family protein [Actinomyces faecalis]|uniref:mechanosensitive ion channel family protein n=1 Tax=Actinomyces faecalis TaxID=2722820 RepID=UPI001557E8A6|nr:mechanosensitive ion channel domain-containing protein [Actinomyces faecalis]